jgi:hypothetical protein
MNLEWLKKYNFQPISETVYLHDLVLQKAQQAMRAIQRIFENRLHA